MTSWSHRSTPRHGEADTTSWTPALRSPRYRPDHEGRKQRHHSGTAPAATTASTTAAAPTPTTATTTTAAAAAATAAAAVVSVAVSMAVPAAAGVIATESPRLESRGPVSPWRAVTPALTHVTAPPRRQWPSRRPCDQDRDQHRDTTTDHENGQQHNGEDQHSRIVSPATDLEPAEKHSVKNLDANLPLRPLPRSGRKVFPNRRTVNRGAFAS